MKDLPTKMVTDGVKALMNEMIFGASNQGPAWVLNQGDAGVIESLGLLSASQASKAAIPGRSTAAGHAFHVLYHLELLVRAMQGENSFATADWAGSWKKQAVTDAEWASVLKDLRETTRDYTERLDSGQEWDAISLTGTMASAAHMAYHLGALRQLLGMFQRRG